MRGGSSSLPGRTGNPLETAAYYFGRPAPAVPGHEDHIHVALTRALKGALGAAFSSIPKIKVSGTKGPLRDMAQSAIDKASKAAESFIESKMPMGPAGGFGAFASFSGKDAELMRQISRARGWNFAHWWELDRRETSHGRNLFNPSSTASLRGQFLDFNWGKYGIGSDPRRNPTMAQQIIAMARYIAERYGNPTRALQWHNAHNWYKLGGIVEPFVGSFRQGGVVPQDGLARVHRGETITPSGISPKIELHMHGPGWDGFVDEVYAVVDGEKHEIANYVSRELGRNISRSRQGRARAGRIP